MNHKFLEWLGFAILIVSLLGKAILLQYNNDDFTLNIILNVTMGLGAIITIFTFIHRKFGKKVEGNK
ncbi:hypothetical protein CJ195_03580 [Bacillus sp. UMB0899]|nr:hypothetical protein CJ195_03580 [Bacillus sp. UMB0899]